MNNKPKVFVIDPWFLTYTKDMAYELSKLTNLEIATNHEVKIENVEILIHSLFFKISNKLKRSFFRTFIRGIEYHLAWTKILKIINRKRFDVIHIQWLLNLPIDIYFLIKVDKYCKKHSIKLVYTAHNAIPHVNGEKSIKWLKKIYNIFDIIIVHGRNTKSEIQRLFPECKTTFYLQKHGAILQESIFQNDIVVNKNFHNIISNIKGKIILLFGNIFIDKGFDRIMRYWITNEKRLSNDLLIIAGRLRESNKNFDNLVKQIKELKNVIYCPNHISEDNKNYFFSVSDIVILPYRKASMSGVVFTAAQFKKTLMTTKVGDISSYLDDNVNAFLVENNDESVNNGIDYIMFNVSKEMLKKMGANLTKQIIQTCSWKNISEKLVNDVYIDR